MCISNNFSTRQYVSDVITKEEVDKWKIQDKILITAGTGTGKTYFCKTILSNITRKSNKKILIVSNRTLLKEQIRQDTFKDRDIIDVVSYQSIEERYIQSAGNLPEDLYSEYLFIFFDEFHYVYSDSEFRMETEYTMFMIEAIKNSIMIFATATPQIIYMDDRLEFAYKYELDYFYSNVKSITIFRETEDMVDLFTKNDYGKSMFFFNSTDKALDAKLLNKDKCSFIVSKNNSRARYNTISDYDSIRKHNKFNAKKLCTTKTLNNGVNIVDEDFNKIFIDIFDPIEIEQCVGRKRFVSEDDVLYVFIKSPSFPYIRKILNSVERAIEDFENRILLSEDEYKQSKYFFKSSNAFTPNMKPRQCYYLSLLYKRDLYKKFISYNSSEDYVSGYYREHATEHCFKDWIDKNTQAEVLVFANLLRQKRVYELLKKYKGITMLQPYVKNTLLSEIREAYVPRNKIDFRTISVNKINSLLAQLNIPIRLTCVNKRIKNIIQDYQNGLLIDIDEDIYSSPLSNKRKCYFFEYDDELFELDYKKMFYL